MRRVQGTVQMSEWAKGLTGPIFVPGMTTNWFQQEAMVRHGQSDSDQEVERGTRIWWARKSTVQSLKSKGKVIYFHFKSGKNVKK